MIELSACIEMLFEAESPDFVSRLALAKDAGFTTIEFWTWDDKPVEELGKELQRLDLAAHLFLVRASGPLTDRRYHAEFLAQLESAAALARSWEVPYLALFCGNELPDISREAQEANVRAALEASVEIADRFERSLVIEPLNTRVDHPGYFLTTTPQAIRIIEDVGSPTLGLAYDAYHSITMGERPADVLAGHFDLVSHVQIADVPGRGEPGSGTVDWTAFLRWLSSQGYARPVGLEYRPSVPTVESLAYIRDCVGAVG
jgi:hydroxypyruvate isomerase